MNPLEIVFSRLFAWFRKARLPFPLTNAWVLSSSSLAILFWDVALIGIALRGEPVKIPPWVFLTPYLSIVGFSWYIFLGSGRFVNIFERARERKKQGKVVKDNILTITWLLLSFGGAVALGIYLNETGLWET